MISQSGNASMSDFSVVEVESLKGVQSTEFPNFGNEPASASSSISDPVELR